MNRECTLRTTDMMAISACAAFLRRNALYAHSHLRVWNAATGRLESLHEQLL